MSLQDDKIAVFNKRVSDLPDNPSPTYSAADIKGYFDSSPEELRLALNKVIDTLISQVVGASGAENIRSAPVAGLTGSSVYELLVGLETQIQALVGSTIPTGSVTSAMLQDGAVTRAKRDVPGQTADVAALWGAYQTFGGF